MKLVKRLLLIALVVLLGCYSHAQTTTYNYLPSTNASLTLTAYGQIQSYLIPAGVSTVKITAAGGTSLYNNNAAIVSAQYNVTPGMYLNILVAGKGYEACGGGGTFVTYESVNRNGDADFATANNVSTLILAAGGAGSNAEAPTTLASNPASLTANNGGGTHGGKAGGNGGVNSTDLHPALPTTKYGGYGGGGSYGFSGGGGGAGFGGALGIASTGTYGGGGGFSGGTNFAGGTSWISNSSLGVISGTQIGTVTTTTVSGNGYVIIQVVTISDTILAQIGADADDTATSTAITVAQLGQIVPAITGIVAANQAAYQAYIDANPNSFSAPATAAEVQAMVTAVNASQANIFYVDASKPDNSGDGLSWATAKKDIQNAIDIASSGKQIWIKAGVYYPNASPNMTASTTVTATSPLTSRDYYIQLKDGVSIYGGFAGTETALSQRNISNNPTYIDGDIGVPGDKTDNCYHLMIYVGTYSTTGVTVDGLVLRNGNATRLAASTDFSEETYIFANGFDNPIPRRIGGGLYVGRGLNNTISNIVFDNNECEVFGAALYLNGISGLFCTYNVSNCYFVNNRMSSSTYGAMCSNGGNVNCYNSVFYNNSCGSNGGDGVALNLMRTKNKIVNCTFANNQSYTGSALNIQTVSATSTETTEIYNCIFYGNTRSNPSFAATSGYDFRKFFAGPTPIVKNCSLMHPSANYTAANYTEMDATSSGNLYEQAPSFSDINNLKGADGKYFTADDGLALTASSALKNAGLNSLLPSILTVDITYASRILATTVDMGAYEIDGALSVSDTILAQIGNEGDSPNTVPSVVTTTQLGQILPAITGIVSANESAYQVYIDANPSLFSAPATAAEVQAMITAVNAQVIAQAASNSVLAQIGNEGDAPNTVTSTVTIAQLGQILPAITGIVPANQAAYQAYIDTKPNLFSSPATQAEVQAMIINVNASQTIVNTFLIGANCGNTINNLAVTIRTPLVSGATTYTFRVVNMVTNAVVVITRPVNSFALCNYAWATLGTLYQIEVSTNGGTSYGPPCMVTTPTPAATIGAQCGTTLTSMGQWIYATYQQTISAYRFRITNTATNAVIVYDASNGLNKFNFNQLPVSFRTTGTTYAVEVALRNTNGMYFEYGSPCNVTTPGIAPVATKIADDVVLTAIAYPNPFADNFMFDVQTKVESTIQIRVYDMLGKLVDNKNVDAAEINNLQLGGDYPSGVYNIILSQEENTQTIRMIKR